MKETNYFHSLDAIHISFKSKSKTKVEKERLGDAYAPMMAKRDLAKTVYVLISSISD